MPSPRAAFRPPSCPCRAGNCSQRQPVAYREAVLGDVPRVGVEAAVRFGWERWLGDKGAFVGMDSFGASAPGAKLYEHFGITPAKVADAARKLLSR